MPEPEYDGEDMAASYDTDFGELDDNPSPALEMLAKALFAEYSEGGLRVLDGSAKKDEFPGRWEEMSVARQTYWRLHARAVAHEFFILEAHSFWETEEESDESHRT